MKINLRLSLLFVFLIQFTFSQIFSGEIVYSLEIIPKMKNVDVDSILSSKQGTKMVYLITDKYYKSTYFKADTLTYSYTYHNETKRMYDEYIGQSYITFRDSRKSNHKYGKSTIVKDSLKTILGRNCFLVRYESSFGNTDTYYSEQVAVDSESFKGHEVGNWYNKLKEVNGAISLYTKTEFQDHYEIRKAIEINEREVFKNEFDLDENKEVVASFYAVDKKPEMVQPSQEVIDCFKNKMVAVAKSRGDVPKKTSYVKFVLTTKGEIKYVEPLEVDSEELYKLGFDIIKNCGLTFTPGEIESKKVNTQIVFPVTL